MSLHCKHLGKNRAGSKEQCAQSNQKKIGEWSYGIPIAPPVSRNLCRVVFAPRQPQRATWQQLKLNRSPSGNKVNNRHYQSDHQ
jgi:hypothetical protein